MTEVFLGIIAGSVLVMAVIQVGVIIFAARAARRVGDVVARFEEDIRPIVANLRTASADAARVTAVAASQIERADQFVTRFQGRIDQLLHAFQESLLRPGREALGLLQALRRIIFGGWTGSRRANSRKGQSTEEEDALFIG